MNNSPAVDIDWFDWRSSLYALRSPNGFNFIFSRQLSRSNVRRQGEISNSGLATSSLGGSPSAGHLGSKPVLSSEYSTSHEKDLQPLRISAAGGNPVSMYRLAEHLLLVEGAANYENATAWLQRSAEAGYVPAQVTLAADILEGKTIQNSARAIDLLQEAAGNGSRLAHVVLAASFIAGSGVPRDRNTGIGWLRRLGATTPKRIGALASHVYAQALGSTGAERLRLSWYAAVFFREAIDGGNHEDEMNLAYLIRRQEVPVEGLPSLDSLLRRHLAAGDPHAVMNEALRMARGIDCPVNWEEADALVAQISDPSSVLEWWRARAAENDPEGHIVLCWLARHGLCDSSESLTWLDQVRSSGWEIPGWLLGVAQKG